jgi:Trk K+ transport system NAD-binding subunit
LPLTLVSLIAYVTADLLKNAPIYESLLENQLTVNEVKQDDHDHYRKIMVETAVHFGSEIENRCLKDLSLPKGCLVIAIRRQGKDITPRGDTVILPEDHLIVLTSLKAEPAVRSALHKIAEVT